MVNGVSVLLRCGILSKTTGLPVVKWLRYTIGYRANWAWTGRPTGDGVLLPTLPITLRGEAVVFIVDMDWNAAASSCSGDRRGVAMGVATPSWGSASEASPSFLWRESTIWIP